MDCIYLLLIYFAFDILIYNGQQKTIQQSNRIHSLRNEGVPKKFRVEVSPAEK